MLEFYFSAGRYGEIYNNPQYDWQKKMKKTSWSPSFMILSRNGKGIYWYYYNPAYETDTSGNYLGDARNKCTKQGYGECFVFAIKNKIVWQNGINPKKGTRIKKKEAKNGMVSIILKELGFYDGDITKTKKIEKKKVEKKKKPKITKKKKLTQTQQVAERVFNNLVFCKNSTGDIRIDINKNCSGSYKKLSKLESINTVEEFEICYKKSSALIINTSIFSRKCNRDWSEYKIKYDGQNFFYGDSNAKKNNSNG